tara:strand:+ start:247 stop:537 length:291 start_codon:yes stop_codon:yes gene_type:complete
MLILNGSAEYMLTEGEQVKGNRHGFNMFVKHDDLNEQLADIEKYLVDRGWDNIEITDNGLIENIEGINHAVLIEAFKKAQSEGLSVVINNKAMDNN